MQHPELPILAFLSAILVLIVAPRQWSLRIVSILALLFWLLLANIIYGVNAIVWAGNVRNPVPHWCDITTKFILATSYAIPLTVLCICKHLAVVSSARNIAYDSKAQRSRAVFEGVVCFAVPVLFLLIHYIVQHRRFDIIENTGCEAAVYTSSPAIIIIWLPRLLFSVTTLLFAVYSLHNFVRRRLTFAAHLQRSNAMLTTGGYLRLLALCLTQAIWALSVTSYSLWSHVKSGLQPWTTWADVHSDFANVAMYRIQDLPAHRVRDVYLSWWIVPVSTIIMFAFLGFGEEAVKYYKKTWSWFSTTILRRNAGGDSKKSIGLFSKKRRGIKPLYLVSLGGMTSAQSSKLNSPASHGSLKSQFFTPSISHLADGSSKSPSAYLETRVPPILPAEPSPSYSFSAPIHPVDLALPIIDRRRTPVPSVPSTPSIIPQSPALTDLDASDTFTLSTFSYYGGPAGNTSALGSPVGGNAATHHHHYITSPVISLFPPEEAVEVAPAGLLPPPRRGPRHFGSNGSVASAASARTVAQGVPEDVGPASHERRRILGISGGRIFVTVEREEQTDAHV